MTSSSNTTRRGFLSTAAALAASAAVANAANALRADPIFEAIEVHQAARLAFENAVSRGSALDEELPSEKTRSWITVWEQTIVETDDPRWIDSVRFTAPPMPKRRRLRVGKHRSDHDGGGVGIAAIRNQHPPRGMARRIAVR